MLIRSRFGFLSKTAEAPGAIGVYFDVIQKRKGCFTAPFEQAGFIRLSREQGNGTKT